MADPLECHAICKAPIPSDISEIDSMFHHTNPSSIHKCLMIPIVSLSVELVRTPSAFAMSYSNRRSMVLARKEKKCENIESIMNVSIVVFFSLHLKRHPTNATIVRIIFESNLPYWRLQMINNSRKKLNRNKNMKLIDKIFQLAMLKMLIDFRLDASASHE